MFILTQNVTIFTQRCHKCPNDSDENEKNIILI